MNKTKDKFRQFCQKNTNIPIFLTDWWLDLTANEKNWDVVIVEKNHSIIAFLPFVKKQFGIFNSLGMPILTPFLGVWVDYPSNQSHSARLSMEKKYFTQLINQLPKFDKFFTQLDSSITNWLPFYWNGFKQTTRYSYVIKNISNIDFVFGNIKSNIKSDIAKAKGKIDIEASDDVGIFYEVCNKTFTRQNKTIPFTKEFIKNLYSGVKAKNAGEIFIAKDKEQNVHAVALLVWDQNKAYYLIGGGDPKLRNSGATSLLIWELIQFSATVSSQFDFEGSMIETIEKFFRGFGGIQNPYSQIVKYNSKAIEIGDKIRNN